MIDVSIPWCTGGLKLYSSILLKTGSVRIFGNVQFFHKIRQYYSFIDFVMVNSILKSVLKSDNPLKRY